MLAAEVQWKYRVKYALNATGGTDRITWHQGILMYYPAEQRAVLSAASEAVPETDAPPPTALDEAKPVSAGFLRPGGRVVLQNTTVMVISDLLGSQHGDNDDDGGGGYGGTGLATKGPSLRNGTGNPPYPKAEPDPRPEPKVDTGERSCWHEILWTRDVQKKSKKWHDGQMCYEHPMATFYAIGNGDADGAAGTNRSNEYDSGHTGHDPDRAGELEIVVRGGDHGKVRTKGRSPLYRKVYNKEGALPPQEGDIIECARLIIEIGPPLKERPAFGDPHQAIPHPHPPTPAPEQRSSLEEGKDKLKKEREGEPPLRRSFDLLYSEDRRTKKIKRWRDGRIQWDAHSGRATFWGEDEQVLVASRATRPDELLEGYEIFTGHYVLQMGAERELLSMPPPERDPVQAQQPQRGTVNVQRLKRPRLPDAALVSSSLPRPGSKSELTLEGNRGRTTSDLLTLLRTSKSVTGEGGAPSA